MERLLVVMHKDPDASPGGDRSMLFHVSAAEPGDHERKIIRVGEAKNPHPFFGVSVCKTLGIFETNEQAIRAAEAYAAERSAVLNPWKASPAAEDGKEPDLEAFAFPPPAAA
jgi:hypothetical protein